MDLFRRGIVDTQYWAEDVDHGGRKETRSTVVVKDDEQRAR